MNEEFIVFIFVCKVTFINISTRGSGQTPVDEYQLVVNGCMVSFQKILLRRYVSIEVIVLWNLALMNSFSVKILLCVHY